MPNSTIPRPTRQPFRAALGGLRTVLGVLFFLLLAQAVPAALPPLDPAVEEIKGVLETLDKTRSKYNNTTPADKAFYNEQKPKLLNDLKSKVNALSSTSHLAGVVLLPEWSVDMIIGEDKELGEDLKDIHDGLIVRFISNVTQNLATPNPPLQIGLLGVLRAESEQLRNPGNSVARKTTVTTILNKVTDQVLIATQDPSDDVKMAAILALGSINSKPDKSAEAFLKVLKTDSVGPRRSVTDAIQAIVTQIKKRSEKPSVNDVEQQFDLLKVYLLVLGQGLQDSDLLVRRRSGNLMVTLIRYLGEQLKPVLPDSETPMELRAGNLELRKKWIDLLRGSALKINNLATILGTAANDPDPVVRALAVASIEQMAALRLNLQGIPSRSPIQLGAPGDPPPNETLPEPGTIRLYPSPVTLLRPVPVTQVRPAIVPVVYLGAPQPFLLPVDDNKKDEDPEKKDEDPGKKDENPGKKDDNAGEILQPAVATSLATLQRSLKDPNIRVRLFALDSLELFGKDAAPLIPDLIATLGDPDKFVRWSATRVLRGLAPRQANQVVPVLTRMLCEKDTGLRKAVMKSLAAFKKDAASALPELIEQLYRADVDVRAEAITVVIELEELGAPAIPALIENLKSMDNKVRQRSAEALGLLGPRAVAANPGLYRLISDDYPEVRRLASQALFRINPPPAMEKEKEQKKEQERDPRDR